VLPTKCFYKAQVGSDQVGSKWIFQATRILLMVYIKGPEVFQSERTL